MNITGTSWLVEVRASWFMNGDQFIHDRDIFWSIRWFMNRDQYVLEW